MGYNVLSGSVSSVYNINASGSFTGSFGGDGANLENVTQFTLYGQTAGGTIPYYKTVSGKTHLEGDSTFTFNPNTDTLSISKLSASSGINLAGIVAGTASTSSYLALDSNNNLIITSSVGGGGSGGPTGTGTSFTRNVVSSSITASSDNYYIGISASSNLDIRLPGAQTLSNGQTFVFKDEIGTANSHDIFILSSGSQTIDGSNSIKLESPFGAINIYSDGTSKFFIF